MSNEGKDYDEEMAREWARIFRLCDDPEMTVLAVDAEIIAYIGVRFMTLLEAAKAVTVVHEGTLAYDGPSMLRLRRVIELYESDIV